MYSDENEGTWLAKEMVFRCCAQAVHGLCVVVYVNDTYHLVICDQLQPSVPDSAVRSSVQYAQCVLVFYYVTYSDSSTVVYLLFYPYQIYL